MILDYWVGIKALVFKYPYKKESEGDFTHTEQKAMCSQRQRLE